MYSVCIKYIPNMELMSNRRGRVFGKKYFQIFRTTTTSSTTTRTMG